MNASSLSGLWAIVIFMGRRDVAAQAAPGAATARSAPRFCQSDGAQDQRAPAHCRGASRSPSRAKASTSVTITSSELSTDARVGPTIAMPARNVVIATTVGTTPIAATLAQARGCGGSAQAGPGEGEADADDGRRPAPGAARGRAPGTPRAEAAAEHDVAGVDERREQGPATPRRRAAAGRAGAPAGGQRAAGERRERRERGRAA